MTIKPKRYTVPDSLTREPRAGPAIAGSKITPAMLCAGIRELARFSPEASTLSDTIADIYQAMETARILER